MRKLPPLNSLKVFEAAARHGSFVGAAAELHVTATAVSHQIKALEEALGLRLFQRRPRGIVLTEAGIRYQQRVTEALDLILKASSSLSLQEVDGPLRLSLPQSLAQHWLSLRLDGLLTSYPGLQLLINGDNRLADLHAGEADIAIRFGAGNYPGLHSELLLSDAASCVIASDKLQRLGDTSTAHLLQSSTLLEDVSVSVGEPWMAWRLWLREAGSRRELNSHYIRFSDSAMALAACLNGQGLSIGRLSLVFEPLRRRQLTALLPWRSTDFAYHVVYREADSENPRVQVFSDWLVMQAREFARHVESFCGIKLHTR